MVPDQLKEIAEGAQRGEKHVATVRILLSWFWGSQRRGSFITSTIRQALAQTKLRTIPDFDATYLDGPITFVPAVEKNTTADFTENIETTVTGIESVVTVGFASAQVDPSYRVTRLKSARTVPLSISPETTISEAITLMMKHSYSQLPVMIGERTVKGLLSWKSLGKRLALEKKCAVVKDAMEQIHIIELDTSLFDAIQLIARYDCVLVKDEVTKICGIITAYDISQTFMELAEPFLLLGEIENLIRDMIQGRFSKTALEAVRDPLDAGRPIDDVSDLSFGGYARLLQDPTAWVKLESKLDRATFVAYLEKVRLIRNDTMHFDPDGIAEDEVQELREFAGLLKQVKQL